MEVDAKSNPWGWHLCETIGVVKNNPKVCNAIKLMKSVVFRYCDIYYFLHCKNIPLFNGDFYYKICNKIFEKNSNLKCYKFSKEITTLNVVTFK